MKSQDLNTHQKALSVNLNDNQYGTIAEIGAGQETARWFFRVGGAAGTIAKAISAYDMKVSDTIYGSCKRYVSRDRLKAMLDCEYRLLIERLDESRSAECSFFAFANTVATYSFSHQTQGHGWLGIRFRAKPHEGASQIVIHVALKSREAAQDQETLGVLGVNLIHAAMNHHGDPEFILTSLMDHLDTRLLNIDMIDFHGPAFLAVDNRLMALRLVQHGLSRAAMFQADGQVVQPADVLYKKAVLVERSRFHPPTLLTMDLLDCACRAFCTEPDVRDDHMIVVSEMSLHNLGNREAIDVDDFLSRVEILCTLGKNVLISDFPRFYRLAEYLFRFTSGPVGIALGVPTLRQIFDEQYYRDLDGGIMESMGRLFGGNLRLYVCPALGENGKDLITVRSLDIPVELRNLYRHICESGYIRELTDINRSYLSILSHAVLEKIRHGDEEWETMVPESVANLIKERHLFSYGCS